MLKRLMILLVLIGVCGWPGIGTSATPEEALRAKVNQGTVAVISGGVNGTYIRIASDLASVLDRKNELRILPIIGKGSVQNITDILYLRNIDIGIVQSDVLTFVRNQRIHPTIQQRIRYITKLYNEELHLLARSDITRIEDLAGKRVNVGVSGSGTSVTASTVFATLKIGVETVNNEEAVALEKLKAGDIAAMVYVAGKPTELFRKLGPDSGLRFVAVAPTPELLETYLPSLLTHEDYPLLVPEGQPIETLAVGAVMAVYNWDPQTDRFQKLSWFVRALFDRLAEFQKPPRHPKWQEVNPAAIVPGWTWFQPAEEWLNQRLALRSAGYDAKLKSSFEAFLRFMQERGTAGSGQSLGPEAREALFKQFLEWQGRQSQ